jgi:ABC-type transport system involved in cytochrome bd biosynthesis fused ATPase/permease subunit
MIGALIGMLVAGFVGLVVVGVVAAVLIGLTFAALAIAIKVIPLLLVGYLVVKVLGGGSHRRRCHAPRRYRGNLSARDREWLDSPA